MGSTEPIKVSTDPIKVFPQHLQDCMKGKVTNDAKVAMSDLEDEGSTTDMGHGCASDTEDSGLSGTECSRGDAALSRNCRFGSSPLETIPATPVGASCTASIASPTRAAMRQARDACKADVLP